jgi:hypothetical protein
MRLLDPRFRYVPAAATDIAATWRRHGFDARKNTERRDRMKERLAAAKEAPAETAAIHPLIRKTA